MSISRFEPTRLVQSLVATNIEVNQATDRYTITKRLFQGSLSVATALAGVAACGSESLGLVVDITCWPIGKTLGALKEDVTSPSWFGSFYQTVSGRPSLSDRIERIVSQALGALISCIQTCLLLFLRDDWAVQLHQSLGNYTSSSKASPSEIPLAPVTLTEVPTNASAPPPLATSTPPRSILKPSPKLEEQTPSSTAEETLQPAPLAPPESGEQALSTDTGAQTSAELKPATGKKKKGGVRINSKAEVAGPKAETPGPSLFDQIKAKGEQQAAKGEQIAAQGAEEEKNKKATKAVSTEGKALLNAPKKKTRRIQSVYFEDYKEGLGRPVQGSILLRDLQKELDNLKFSEDESMLAKTFGEYVLIKFAENNIPIEIAEKCELKDSWDKKFTIEILKARKDTDTGKDIILQAAIDWKEFT